jgi:TolA-binding protein
MFWMFMLLSSVVLAKMQGPSQEMYYSTSQPNISEEAQKQADEIRLKTLASIKELLKRSGTEESRRFELMLREGELYAERHDYLRDMEVLQFNRNHDQWIKSGKKGKEPAISHKVSQGELLKATQTFRKLVDRYPRHPRTAAALYALGKSLSRLGNTSAPIYFEKIIKQHPKSPLVPDAYLSLGEHYFEQHNIAKAIPNYQKMISFKDHPSYTYAVYKLGWAFYNVESKNKKEEVDALNRAIASFKLVVKLTEKPSQGRLSLREEALKDLVMVWSELEDTDAAWTYFKSLGEQERFYDLVERMGNAYEQQGRFEQAVAMFVRLIRESPTRQRNYEIYAKLNTIFEQQNKVSEIVNNIKDMHKVFFVGSPWLSAHGKNAEVVKQARDRVEFHMHRYSTLFHTRGQKAKSDTTLQSSAELYSLYLSSFPDSSKRFEIMYYYAEILNHFKKFESASDYYFQVAKSDFQKHKKDAAMNAVLALYDQDKLEKYAKLPELGKVPKAIDIPKIKQKMIQTIDFYVSQYPKEKDTLKMQYTAALTLFEYGHYPESLKRFDVITKTAPQSEQSVASIRLMVGYYAELGQWQNIQKLTRQSLANKAMSDKSFREYLTAMLQKAMYNEALVFEKAGEHEKAARAFVAYEKEFSWDRESADRALHNASINFRKVGLLEDSIAAQRRLIDSYPKSNLVKETLVALSQTYEALGEFKEAALFYSRFAASYPRDEKAPESLFNAGLLYRGVGEPDRAVDHLLRFATSYPKHELGSEAVFSVAQVLERQAKISDALKHYERVPTMAGVNADRALLAQAKSAVLAPTRKDQSVRGIMRQLMRHSATPAHEARRLIAGYRFDQLDTSFQNYMAMKVDQADQIEQSIQKKQAQLEQLAAAYQEVMTVGSSEHSVASLYRLGQLHENFADTLSRASVPAQLNDMEREQFRSQLDKIAFPIREEAYKFFETSFQRSSEVETFSDWTRLTYEKMVALNPSRNPEVLEIQAEPKYMMHKVSVDRPL